MKVVIAGGTGFIGQAITRRLLDRGDEVTVLSRRQASADTVGRVVVWDGRSVGRWADELEGADAVVNTTGESIGVRPTRRNVARLIDSRVEPIRALRDAIERLATPPRTWIQTSAVGVFGDTGDAELDELTPPTGLGPHDLVSICLAWEHAFAEASSCLGRAVSLRLGVVIGGGDRLTATLAPLVRRGLGGRAGSGRQWVAWVGLADAVEVYVRAIDNPTMTGLHHVTAPNPVRNQELMATFRKVLGVRFGLPAPAPAVRLGAFAQGSNPNLVLASQRAVPRRLLDLGFTFAEPELESVLRDALAANG